jgi:hypothetical protein
MRRALAFAACAALAGCGYHAAVRGAPLAGGAQRVSVPPFDARTADAEVGAFVTEAVREDLARRGVAAAGDGAPSQIDGVVEETVYFPSSPNGATWRLALVVSAKLVTEGKPAAEARVRREVEYLAGQDPLETEGRRRIALRRASEAAARELLEKLEAR